MRWNRFLSLVMYSLLYGGIAWTGDPLTLNSNATTDLGEDSYAQVATNAEGLWIAVWASTDDLGGTIGTDSDILIAYSLDGLSWSPPLPLSPTAYTDSAEDLEPSIFFTQSTGSTSGNTEAFAVIWSSDDDLGGTIGNDRDILFMYSGDSVTWNGPDVLNSNADVDTRDDVYPRFATEGDGQWIAVWESWDDLGGAIGADADIVYAHSDDGHSWYDAAPLNSDAATDVKNDLRPQIATDGDGHWIVAWHSADDLAGADGEIWQAHSLDYGWNWSSATRLNSNAQLDTGDDRAPHIASDGAAQWVVVWESDDTLENTLGSDADILFARSSDGYAWDPPQALSDDAATDSVDDRLPRIATDGNGNWITVWGSSVGVDQDPRVAHSYDGGDTWVDRGPLNPLASMDTGDDIAPDVVTDRLGNWIATWHSTDDSDGTIGSDADVLLAACLDQDGDGFGLSDGPLCFPGTIVDCDDVNVHCTTDCADQDDDGYCAAFDCDDGRAYCAEDCSDEDGDGFCSLYDCDDSDASSTMECYPGIVNNNAASDLNQDQYPRIADDLGSTVVVWQARGYGIDNDYDIVFARSQDLGLSWSDPSLLDTGGFLDRAEDSHPDVAADPIEGHLVVWQSKNDLGGTIGGDFDILFSRSSTSDPTWSDPAPVNTDAASDAGDHADERPSVAMAMGGTAVVAWQSRDYVGVGQWGDYDIFLAELFAANWSDPRRVSGSAATGEGDDFLPDVATNGTRSVAVWVSDDDLGGTIGDDQDILVAAGDVGGVMADPRPIDDNAATDNRLDSFPAIATNGSTWIVVWTSEGDFDATDILMARSVDGGATWSAPVALNDVPEDDPYRPDPDIVWTASAWIAVWAAPRGGDGDIIVSRSLDDGVTWSQPERLYPFGVIDTWYDWSPALANGSFLGRPIAVWVSSDDLNGRIGNDEDILVSQCIDFDGDNLGQTASALCLAGWAVDCNDSNRFCGLSCLDVDADGYCVDHDCNDSFDTCTTSCVDADHDGHDVCGDDCDDTSPTAAWTYPHAAEHEPDPFQCRKDVDNDGWGDLMPPPGVVHGQDCNDDDPITYPESEEICDGADNNCDGVADEGIGTPEECNAQDDNCNNLTDEGNPGGGAACDTGNPGVCGDGTITCHFGAFTCDSNRGPGVEECNGLDDDCDGDIDEAEDPDGDGVVSCQGDLDLVTGNAGEQWNRLYLNDGDGSPWDTATAQTIGDDQYSTFAVVLGDVDRDGYLDLVAGSRFQTHLYRNTGAPPFLEVGVPIAGETSWVRSLALGDVNGDGLVDLVTGEVFGTETNKLYLNDGTGWTIDTTAHPITDDTATTFAVSLADLDGDGDLDLVVGNHNAVNRTYFNDGDGTPWDTVTSGTAFGDPTDLTYAVATGDVDGDGDVDVVAGNYEQRNYLYLNDGSGGLAAGIAIGEIWGATRSLALGDVDGDDDLDLVVGNEGQVNRLYLNDGSGDPWDTSTPIAVSADIHYTSDVALADVDGDGDLDLVVANSGGMDNDAHDRLYLNDGTGVFGTGTNIGGVADSTLSVALGDIDGDSDGGGKAAVAPGRDNCPEAFNPDQGDMDSDGIGDACDCAPSDPGNPPPPAVSDSLRLIGVGPTVLYWNAAGNTGPYRVYRGWRKFFLPWDYNHATVGPTVAVHSIEEDFDPGPETLWYYLVTRVGCGESPLGHRSDGSPIPNAHAGPAVGTDADGDGVEDESDNCPNYVNPSQSDFDRDLQGDVCDPDPTNPGP